jgi:hypothetical protein
MEENQGIMSLPMGNEPMPAPAQGPQLFTPEQASAIDFARSQTNPNEVSQETFKALEQADPGLVLEIRQALAGEQLPPELVEELKRLIDEILSNPAGYQELRADILSDPETAEIFEDLLPPMFDITFFTSFRVVLDQLPSSSATGIMGSSPAMSGMGMLPGMGGMPVQGFAEGGIAELKPIAQALSQMGRNGDTMLAHINPQEAMMLRRMGGSGTINPYTGLPEFFKKFFKSVGKAFSGAIKGIGNIVKKVASSPIGRIALTIAAVYFMGPAGLNLASGTLGVTNAALAMGINTFAGSTLVNLASGMKAKDALKQGLVSGILAGATTGFTQGFDATVPTSPITVTDPNTGLKTEVAVKSPGAAPTVTDAQYQDIVSGTSSPSSLAGETQVAGVYTPSDVSANVSPADYSLAAGREPSMGLSTRGFADVNYRPDLAAAEGSRVSYSLADGPLPGVKLDSGITFFGSDRLMPPPDFVLAPSLSGVPSAASVPAGFDPRLALGDVGPGGVSGSPVVTDLNIRPTFSSPSADYLSSADAANLGGGTGMDLPGPSAYDRATDALKRGYQGAKDVYTEYISPSRGMPTPEAISTRANAIRLADGVSADKAYDLATQQLTPGMISRYAPVAGVGLGVAALSGAFTPEEPPEPKLITGPTGIDLYQANPEQYRPNIYAGQTPVTYQDPNQALYRQQQYAAYNPFFYAPQSRSTSPSYSQPLFRKEGGITETSKFKRKMGAINGPGTEKSDDIPAMLSDGEFVFTARAVRGMGNGSRRKGAKEMYRLMKMLEKKVGSRS